MTSTSSFKALSFGAVAAAILVSSFFMPAGAHARKGYGPSVIEKSFITDGPVKGYSGFVRGGARNFYCDYQRIPNRKCTYTADGRERCKIVNWTLKQFCY